MSTAAGTDVRLISTSSEFRHVRQVTLVCRELMLARAAEDERDAPQNGRMGCNARHAANRLGSAL
jgi:hypothetical protein